MFENKNYLSDVQQVTSCRQDQLFSTNSQGVKSLPPLQLKKFINLDRNVTNSQSPYQSSSFVCRNIYLQTQSKDNSFTFKQQNSDWQLYQSGRGSDEEFNIDPAQLKQHNESRLNSGRLLIQSPVRPTSPTKLLSKFSISRKFKQAEINCEDQCSHTTQPSFIFEKSLTPNLKSGGNNNEYNLFSPLRSNFKNLSLSSQKIITNREDIYSSSQLHKCSQFDQLQEGGGGDVDEYATKRDANNLPLIVQEEPMTQSRQQSTLQNFFHARGYLHSIVKQNKSDISFERHIQQNDKHGQILQDHINYHIEQVSQTIGQKRRLEKCVKNSQFQLKEDRKVINKTLAASIATKGELRFHEEIQRDKQKDVNRLKTLIQQIKQKISNYSHQKQVANIQSIKTQLKKRVTYQKQQLQKQKKQNDITMQQNKNLKQEMKTNLREKKKCLSQLLSKYEFYRKAESIRMQRIFQKGKILKHIVDKQTLSGKMYDKKRVWKEDMDHITKLNQLINK